MLFLVFFLLGFSSSKAQGVLYFSPGFGLAYDGEHSFRSHWKLSIGYLFYGDDHIVSYDLYHSFYQSLFINLTYGSSKTVGKNKSNFDYTYWEVQAGTFVELKENWYPMAMGGGFGFINSEFGHDFRLTAFTGLYGYANFHYIWNRNLFEFAPSLELPILLYPGFLYKE